MSAAGPLRLRRVLVALDLSAHGAAALEAAAALAARLDAELQGLYIEDEELLRFAAHPAARVLREGAAAAQALTREALEAELALLAREARRALEEAARRAGSRHAFAVARDRVAAALVRAAGEAGLLVLGRSGHAPRPARTLGSTARSVLADAPGAVLLLHAGERVEGPVLAVDDGSPAAGRALALAQALAAPGEPAVLRTDALDAPRLAAEVQRRGAALLVLPSGAGGDEQALLAALPCAVLRVR